MFRCVHSDSVRRLLPDKISDIQSGEINGTPVREQVYDLCGIGITAVSGRHTAI